MKLHRGTLFGVLLPLVLALGISPALGAFTNVVTLVLRQGDIPTTNGANVVGASAYTGTVDTYVDRGNPDTSYGAAPIIRFGMYTNPPPYVEKRGYLRFDNFQTYLPAGAKITRALLYLTSAGSIFGNGSPYIYYRGWPWDGSLTWNTDTGTASSVMIGHMYLGTWAGVPGCPSNRVDWLDITAFAQAWHVGTLTNYGLQWGPGSGWDVNPIPEYTFHSCENSVTTNRPRLVIDYVVGGQTYRRPDWIGSGWSVSRMEMLSGSNVFDDTYIAGMYYGGDDQRDVNFGAATVGSIRTYNGSSAPKRALLKIKMNHPKLAALAKSTDPIRVGQPRLVSAYLQTVGEWSWDNPYSIWTLAQDWDVSQVTYSNRYTNPVKQPWAQGWPGTESPMSNVVALVANSTGDSQFHRGGTKLTDITALVQAYADGTNNCGVLLGHMGWAAYDNYVYFTEDSLSFRRPTLILQIWDPASVGTLMQLR